MPYNKKRNIKTDGAKKKECANQDRILKQNFTRRPPHNPPKNDKNNDMAE